MTLISTRVPRLVGDLAVLQTLLQTCFLKVMLFNFRLPLLFIRPSLPLLPSKELPVLVLGVTSLAVIVTTMLACRKNACVDRWAFLVVALALLAAVVTTWFLVLPNVGRRHPLIHTVIPTANTRPIPIMGWLMMIRGRAVLGWCPQNPKGWIVV